MIEPNWSKTVGQMASAGVSVHWDCHNCKGHGLLDLDKVVAAMGPDFSLWDQMRHCDRCGGIISYSAAYRPGNWPFQLMTDSGKAKLMQALDDAWHSRKAQNAKRPA